MGTTQNVLLVVAVLVVLLIVAVLLFALRRRQRSQQQGQPTAFADEHVRTVEPSDPRLDAEREPASRRRQQAPLDIRPLSPASRDRYLKAWEGVQSRFVDSPVLALSEADALLTRLLAERGFPTDGLRRADPTLPAEHGRVLEGFRAGHAIEQANTTRRSDTEQVRRGMLHFREVFDELVAEPGGDPYPAQPAAPSREATPAQETGPNGEEGARG